MERSFYLLVLANTLWIGWEALLANRNQMLLPQQMQMAYPNEHGIPFIMHGGMALDLLLFGPLLSYITVMWGGGWELGPIISMSTMGLLLSVAAHYSWLGTTTLDSLVCRGKIRPAGWLHLFYMAWAIATLGLFFFYSDGVPRETILAITVLLWVHFFFGTHLFLAVVQRFVRFKWLQDMLNRGTIIPFIAIVALSSGLALYKI